jgi:hypothetical protein
MVAHSRPARRKAVRTRNGFIRHELYLLAASLGILRVVVVPRCRQAGWRSAVLGLLAVLGCVLAAGGGLLLLVWLPENLSRPGTGWKARTGRGIGALLRFALCGFVGLAVATALVAQHRLGPGLEAGIPLASAAACGGMGLFLHGRLGGDRFWPAFRKLGLALAGSLVGGMLGILGPEPWAVDAGIAAPLVLFFLLAATGRIVPRR